MVSRMGDEEIPTELVAGKYRLTKLLGRGGMGSVWEGVHISLGTRVACKFIEAEYADSVEARSRFENEARAAAALRSKHVVEVYDHGVTDDGRPYIVMEYLAGEPLDSRLTRVGRLSLADTAQIITHVSRALAKAHQAGIVHRDLKPENIFLVWDEEDSADIAKVVDFGIAKFTDKSVGISSSTRTGSVLGTPYYMSPEQARGLRTVDYRADLWSLGVIAFRCVVGRLPFEGEALGDLLVKLCTAPIPIPSQFYPGLPATFDAWMLRALARDPESRFQDARGMAHELSQLAGLGRGRLQSSYDGEPSGAASGQHSPSGSSLPQYGAQGTPPPHFPNQTTPQPLSQGARVPTPGTALISGAAITNAALTATPPVVPTKSRAPLLVAGIVLVAGLGVGAFAIAGSMSSGDDAVAAGSGSALDGAPEVPPKVVAAPAVTPVDNDVPSEGSDEAAAPSAPSASPVKPVSTPRKTSSSARKSVVAVAPVAEQPPAAPAPPPPPAPAPSAAAPAPKKKKGIDVGY